MTSAWGSEGMTMGGTFTYAWARPTIPDASVLALGRCSGRWRSAIRSSGARRRRSAPRPAWTSSTRTSISTRWPLTRDRLRVGFLRLGFDAAKTDYGQRRLERGRAAMAREQPARIAPGPAHPWCNHHCGPLGASFASGRALIEPSRPEGQADATVLRYTVNGEVRPYSQAHLRARRPRPICVEAAAQLRGIRWGAIIPPGAAMTPASSSATGALERRRKFALAAVFQRARARRRSKAMPSGTTLWSGTSTRFDRDLASR